jgi:hypothetical protein
MSAPLIQEEERRYGYIKGIYINDEIDIIQNRGLYVVFENNNVWKVPDLELFKLLSQKLIEDAWIIENTDDHGYNKLYISKKNGKWEVELP